MYIKCVSIGNQYPVLVCIVEPMIQPVWPYLCCAVVMFGLLHTPNNSYPDCKGPPRTYLEEDVNRKAAIVIEHIIQASDVVHTKQHWHVFCRWNENLYHEMYAAYLAGRSNKDPSVDWYESEIGFFDHNVIPLARKLKECGVFCVSSDEYLQYALANRQEWASKGEQVTKEMIARRIQN